jgi:CubicO group peptidase (beta-lactamase class C family)
VSNLDGYETAFARVDEVVERAVEQGQVPGVVAAVARGEVVHVATAGVMAVGGVPMRRDTLFRISSTTKPMTATAAEMTRDQLTAGQRANVWPGFSFLGERGWGFGLSVLDDGRYTWEGGFGTAWSNVPSQDLTVVVLTQRAADETGMPAV